MDTENNDSVTPKPPPLNSDQLNYLIWRYLQEAGYAEAAVKLQRDWKVDVDSLSFAKYIKGQALISLVQKGLRYHHLSLTVDENGQQTKALVPSMFFFGPESVGFESGNLSKETMLKASDSIRGVSPASTITQLPKSKPRDIVTTTSNLEEPAPQPVKRGRKPAQSLSADRPGTTSRKVSGPGESEAVNGHAQESDHSPSFKPQHAIEGFNLTNGHHHHHHDRMDVDTDNVVELNDVQMEEATEDPILPLVPTLINGESVAVQVMPTKVVDLTSNSAILPLERSQTISRASWGSETLTVQGEAFCGAWNLSGQDLQPNSVKPLLKSLLPPGKSAMVTAAAWNAKGTVFALATWSEQSQVHLFDGQDFGLLEILPASRRPITMLRWHSNNLRLVGIAPDEEDSAFGDKVAGSIILVWNVSSGHGASTPSTLKLPYTVFDIDTFEHNDAEDRDIVVACNGTIYHCSNSDDLRIIQKWTTNNPSNKEVWTSVRAAYSRKGGLSVVAAATDPPALWLPRYNVLKEHVHSGPITGLEVRARQHVPDDVDSIELVTSSLDGFVKVWEYTTESGEITCKRQLRLNPHRPVMCLALSPNQSYIAAGSWAVVRVWDTENDYRLTASWEGREPEWKGSSIRDEELASAGGKSSVNGEDSNGISDHTLAWQAGDTRLAFGLGSQVAIINFQR